MPLTVPVAIDGRRLQEYPLTGVGRWLANLLPYLATEADIVLLTDAGRRPAAFSIPGTGLLAEAPLWLPARAPELVWIQLSVPRWLRRFHGVFHGTFNQLPVAWRGPAVVTFHDLATLDHPEDFAGDGLKRMVWNAQFRQAARQAAAIQTDSEYIRQAVLATYPVDPARVVVAAPSVDPVFNPQRKARGRARAASFGVTGNYVVAVGGAPRRGLSVAVDAWAQARAHGAVEELVVVGNETPAPRPGLFAVGRLADEPWADLLAGATALCYPTRYEGFGMPALEAAASGVPVVCARVGPLPEVMGDAPEWCEATTVASIAAGLERLLADPARQARRRQAGLARAAAAPSWAHAARVLIDTYARVAR
ncbi:MAG: glycosyltransferase family 4 protein [Actinomycetota bacterium]|nr:glycosyltransferase family 4 protein [Actinomycetota bacterium]